ncbi:hypothetical protein BMUNKI379_25185 [Burkholderia multivorans]|nr:hypothetical protein BMUNKI379_25185 [Burkholderia multivorans]
MVSGLPFRFAGIRMVRTKVAAPLAFDLAAVFPTTRCGFFLRFLGGFFLGFFGGLLCGLFSFLLRQLFGLFLGQYFSLLLCDLLSGLLRPQFSYTFRTVFDSFARCTQTRHKVGNSRAAGYCSLRVIAFRCVNQSVCTVKHCTDFRDSPKDIQPRMNVAHCLTEPPRFRRRFGHDRRISRRRSDIRHGCLSVDPADSIALITHDALPDLFFAHLLPDLRRRVGRKFRPFFDHQRAQTLEFLQQFMPFGRGTLARLHLGCHDRLTTLIERDSSCARRFTIRLKMINLPLHRVGHAHTVCRMCVYVGPMLDQIDGKVGLRNINGLIECGAADRVGKIDVCPVLYEQTHVLRRFLTFQRTLKQRSAVRILIVC